MGRRCKRGQNLAPQNTRRGCLKDPTRTTKNEPNTTATLTRTALRLLRRAGPSEKPIAAARVAATRGKRLHLEPEKTRPHRRPDVLAPGCGSIMFTETPGNRPGDVAGSNSVARRCGSETTNYCVNRRHGLAGILRAGIMSRDHDGPTLHTIHNTARPFLGSFCRRGSGPAVLPLGPTGADVPRTAPSDVDARPSHEVPR